ncbi:Ferredoxin [Lachnospiraceae bacterium TWA4]|nr:Ferredoxin [Lachnospiraceae bacterium TWA4]
MIFYFTGTGNSFYVASELAKDTDEQLVDMGQAVKHKRFTYEIAPNEKVGFVFPVYFMGLPSAVTQFISKMELNGVTPHHYIYSVITCGNGIAGANQMLENKLERACYHLTVTYKVVMPENYMIMFDAPTQEEQEKIFAKAENTIRDIKEDIEMLNTEGYESTKKDFVLSTMTYSLYQKGRKTKKFWVDDQCVSCHACENRCPSNAIRLIDGVPTWVKDQCVHCLQCTRCGAIHYGKALEKHGRYKHPVFRKKVCH